MTGGSRLCSAVPAQSGSELDQTEMMEDSEACSKLRNAVKQGNITRLEEALDLQGVNPNLRLGDMTSHTPLTSAVEMARTDLARLLLSHPATDPNMKGVDGFTPLTLAVTKGAEEMVSVLLESERCDVNTREGGGMTALHLAVIYNNINIVQTLLADKRTSRDLKVEGQTALQLASSLHTNDNQMVDILRQPHHHQQPSLEN